MSTQKERVIGFIGSGKMGGALAMGVVKSGVAQQKDVVMFDAYTPILDEMRSKGFPTASSIKQIINMCDLIFIAVKPQMFDEIKSDFQAVDMSKKVVVSILPGITLEMIAKISPCTPNFPVVRVMPNTPCLVNKSASAYCANKFVSASDKQFINSILSGVGICYEVPEGKMEAVTGVSGSGPAYVYMVIEAMADAGVKLGLTRDVATKLAAQTVVGAGQMVLETGSPPASLKSDVCSPGGSTICAVAELERLGLRHAVMRAVEASCEKSQELGKLG